MQLVNKVAKVVKAIKNYNKKYELVKEDTITIDLGDKTLYRIKALKDFGYVNKGDLGGYIQSYNNLSQEGNSWVYDSANVSGETKRYNSTD